MAKVETIKVIDYNRRGYKIINKSDYDNKIHTRFTKKMEKELEKEPDQTSRMSFAEKLIGK